MNEKRATIVDRSGASAALEAARLEERRLRRALRRLSVLVGLASIAAVGWLLVAARSSAAGALDAAGLAVVVAAAAGAWIAARRVRARLALLREDLFTLTFLRDVIEHEGSPGLVALTHPYRAHGAAGARLPSLPVGRAPDPASKAPPPDRRRAHERASRPLLAYAGWLGAAAAVAAALLVAGGAPAPRAAEERRWMFVDEVTDPAALGLVVADVAAGIWELAAHEEATGARALVNGAGTPGEPPATAVVREPATRDLRLATRCRVSTERPHQACGLVFRQIAPGTHYVARVEHDGVHLGVVMGGVERAIRTVAAPVDPTRWQELAVEARGDHLTVAWNGERVIDVHDPTLGGAGAAGLWAPSDCVAYFDELTLAPLPSTLPHSNELLPHLL